MARPSEAAKLQGNGPGTERGTSHIARTARPTRDPGYNRIGRLMEHIPWYSIQGQVRLARDAGVSPSALCRLMSGRVSPSFAVVWAITKALETRLGRPLDPRELVSVDGTYPTATACALAGCRGCTPQRQYEQEIREQEIREDEGQCQDLLNRNNTSRLKRSPLTQGKEEL